MVWVVFFCVFVILLVVLLALLTVEVLIHYKRDASHDSFKLRIQSLGGILHYQFNVPVSNLIHKTQDKLQMNIPVQSEQNTIQSPGFLSTYWPQIESFLDKFKELWRKMGSFRDKVISQLKIFRVYELNWKTEFGVGDAAATGTLTGIAWALKGSIIGFISHFMSLQELPKLEVKPAFFQQGFSTDVTCIIRFRLGEAIVAGAKLAIYWLRRENHGASY